MHSSVVTIMYPKAIRFITEYYETLLTQNDLDFDLWIGLDGLSKDDLPIVKEKRIKVNYVITPENASFACVRNITFGRAIENSDLLIFVDADDMLNVSRVEAAKSFLQDFDITASALEIVDEKGNFLGCHLYPENGDPNLLFNNVFGFTNTTWRSETLKSLLPIPDECAIIDWYLSTMALYSGAKMGFDHIPRAKYRQYSGNIGSVITPFTTGQILKSTNLVLKHYDLILKNFNIMKFGDKKVFMRVRNRLYNFKIAICEEEILKIYTETLNNMPNNHVWWSCVAHPKLEEIWNT